MFLICLKILGWSIIKMIILDSRIHLYNLIKDPPMTSWFQLEYSRAP